jgi:hypothetical protein
MADAPMPAAAFYADPFGRFANRFWDGDRWTDQVSSDDGTVSTDPVTPIEPTDGLESGPPQLDEPPWNELQDALAAYSRLVEDAEAGRIDESTFRREAVRVGMVVTGGNVWIIDLVNQQWHHYDGFQLRTLQLTETG